MSFSFSTIHGYAVAAGATVAGLVASFAPAAASGLSFNSASILGLTTYGLVQVILKEWPKSGPMISEVAAVVAPVAAAVGGAVPGAQKVTATVTSVALDASDAVPK